MIKFLLDANVSYETAEFLKSLGYDVKTVAQFNLEGAEDIQIIEKTLREKRVLITFDLDFGEIFYFSTNKSIWIIVLRLRDQTVESVNKRLDWFLKTKTLNRKKYQNTLIVVEEGKIRVRRKPDFL